MTDLVPRTDFGPVLREWRVRRHRSQLELSIEAGVSQRHISYLETGRSKPSREMVVHLGLVLEVPLRDRNSMLVAAGFAPVYTERSLDDPELADIKRVLETMLAAHGPFPAYLVDRGWNLVSANDAAVRLIGRLPERAQQLAGNVLRFVCHPDGLRTVSADWDDVAAVTLRRLQSELAAAPTDDVLAALFNEALDQPGVPDLRALGEVPSRHDLLIPMSMDLDGQRLSMFTTITALMSPCDVTLEELRIETLLPADPVTEEALRAMAS